MRRIDVYVPDDFIGLTVTLLSGSIFKRVTMEAKVVDSSVKEINFCNKKESEVKNESKAD